jgi:hypothetical protein
MPIQLAHCGEARDVRLTAATHKKIFFRSFGRERRSPTNARTQRSVALRTGDLKPDGRLTFLGLSAMMSSPCSSLLDATH